MKTWMIIVAIVLVLGLLYLATGSAFLPLQEGFLTLDPKATATQRSLLQMEGERRYNDLARVQNPSAMVSADSVDAAVRNLVPTPTSQTDSLLSVLGFTEFSAADDGTNKIGDGVEQTGMVQSKINFCESLTTIDCDLLTDPRMAECGFCHKNGVNSNGKAHRGGMFISSDDQIRANERAGEGNRATYEPTIGTCKNGNFTLTKKNCEARENAIKCQKEGAATTSNSCGQCFGSTGPGLTGFLYMGPEKLKTTTVRLTVSHPGMHMMPDGTGTMIKVGDKTYTLPASNAGLLNPYSVTIEIKEGDIMTLMVYGIPKVWTAWLSNDANTRSIGLSLGETGIQPAGGLVIAGDSNSSIVRKAVERMNVKDQYASFKKTIPNGVLFYQRREIMPPAVLSAYYGNTSDPSQSTQDMTSQIKKYAVAGGNFDNDGGTAKASFLYIKLDNGNTKIVAAGTQPKIIDFYNFIAFTFQMPGSLTEPYYDEDKNACPTGQLILTEIGAGLMGANSCFDSAGVFSASLSCIRNLFIGCGGTNKGTLYPKTAADAAALAQKDPTTGKVAIDATVTYLNNLTNIALFGVDSNNSPVGFVKQKDHALKMLGVSLNNPCEGPALNTGPHSAECLDYLYRTSGDNSKDGMQVDPTKLPYNYCNKNGTVAPYRKDGTVNEKAVEEANQYGGVANVRAYYNSIYARSKDSYSFDAQADAMQKCFNTALKPPAVVAGECPAPNPDEWQCFGPSKLAKAEVFQAREGGRYAVKQADANGVCQKYGARLATKDELIKAQQMGADWCSTGWVSDNPDPMWPITTTAMVGCGNAGVQTWNPGGKADVNCFGRKPAKGTASENILPFNQTSWYNPLSRTSPAQITLIPAISPGRVLRHAGFAFWVHPVDGSSLQGLDASFEIVDALNGNPAHVSFRSVNFPDRYITVETNNRVGLNVPAADRSCFLITAPLNGNVSMMSLQSVAFPGRYICTPRPDATDVWCLQVDVNNPNASTWDGNNGKVSPTLASWTRTVSLYLQQNAPFSSNQIPACLFNQNQNQVQCASNDGRTPIAFTTESECNTFVSAGSAVTSQRAQPPPALSKAVYDYLSARV